MAKEILIADSDKADQEEFQKIFETTDYHLVFCESGSDVLLRVKLFKPDLIIAGTDLSEKNGLELCEAIKGDPEFNYIPFILLLNTPEEISEKERNRLKPDGILSKPLHEGQVLNMVDRLLESMRGKGEGMFQRETEWEALGDREKEEFSLDEFVKKEEEEIIELMDVVEEPESRMSINDFAIQEKEDSFGEITPLDSWQKMEGEEKIAAEEGFILSPKGEAEEREEVSFKLEKEVTQKEAAQEEELFEKIEFEDILGKMDQMQPPSEVETPLEKAVRVVEEEPPAREEAEEKSLGLEEFETLLKKGVEAEPSKAETIEETLQSFAFEEPKLDVPEEISPIEIPEEELEELEEAAEEGFPEDLLEESLEEEKVEAVQGLEEEEIEAQVEEELEEFEAEELKVMEEPEEEGIELFEGLEAPDVSEGEVGVVKGPTPVILEKPEEIEAAKFFEEEAGVRLRRTDQKMEEVISEGVRTMMEELITKHVPEMTKDIIGLTIERIEKMVKEIVPDLAAKMIEDEIKRLEKGETD